MELEIIREFTLLAETCNFQVAADHLSLSQSALSKHIHKLEEDLEMDLFDRSRRSVSLNENGEAFLQYAREICKLWDECSYAMNKRRKDQENTLHIGLMIPYDHHELVEKLTKYCAANPNVHVNMIEQESDLIKAKLTSGECDFVFTVDRGMFDESEFEVIPYIYDRLVLLIPRGHELSGEEKVDISRLPGEKIIEHSSYFEHSLLQEIQEKYGLKFNIIACVSYSSSIFRMVHQGIGIALISEGCADQYEKFDIEKTELEQDEGTQIYLVYRRRKLQEEAKKFLDYITGK